MLQTTGTTSSNEALYAFDAAKRAEHGVLDITERKITKIARETEKLVPSFFCPEY